MGEYRNIPARTPRDSERFDDLVWRQAAANPDAPAVLGSLTYDALTYGELIARAEGIAVALLDAGCAEGTVVGLVLDRSPELLAALLAVLRVGGTCLPIAPTDPVARVAMALDTVDPSMLVTTAEFVDRVPGGRPVILVGDTAPAPVVERPSRSATAPAVIFCTSGSTGVPKAVVVTHHNYTSQLDWVAGNFGLSGDEVHLLKAPVSFVSLLRQFIWPLATGGSIVIVPAGREHDVPFQARLIDEHQVTFMTFITPALQAFLRYARLSGSSVRTVVTGGDRYPLGLARGFFRVFPNARMQHTYGMTEGTLVLCALLDHPDVDETSLGIVVPGAVAVLLDEDGTPVPPGGSGEIHIGGVPLTPGYLNQPELNAERFLPGPDGPLFATRDRARHRADGTFELIGRADNMVKVRGFRVELGEVEQALAQHPSVAHAVCGTDTAPTGETRLIAYLQAESVTDQELRQFLRTTLRDYMVPSRFVRLDAFPLTPNGKVKRDELAALAASATSPVGAAVREEWVRVLAVAEPAPSADFFDLGGTSMSAMELAASLGDRLEVEVPLTAVLTYTTLRDFTEHVEKLCADR